MRNNKLRRLLVSLITAVMLLIVPMSSVYASHNEPLSDLSNARLMAEYTHDVYSEGKDGPICIAKAKLTLKNGKKENVYLISLSGTEKGTYCNYNQSTFILTDLASGFNVNNLYYLSVVKAIRDKAKIPKGSKLILTGHSLGGMIAQQVAANPLIKKEYKVKYTVTFGSPLISMGFREGTIKRMGDTIDPVPYLSINTLTAPIHSIAGLNRERGTYKNPVDAHCKSYHNCTVWEKYDALGFKKTNNKGATVKVDVSSIKYYPAPIIDYDLFKKK